MRFRLTSVKLCRFFGGMVAVWGKMIIFATFLDYSDMRKCGEITKFNANCLAKSNNSLLSLPLSQALARTPLIIYAGDPRVNIRLFLHPCKGSRIVFSAPPGADFTGNDCQTHKSITTR